MTETPAQKISRLANEEATTGGPRGLAECGCPNLRNGTAPILHICPRCGFESGYRLHKTCAGCNYRREMGLMR